MCSPLARPLLTVLVCLAAIPAQADRRGGPLSGIRVGPQAGVYLPSSGRTADRFGETWFSIGLGFGQREDGDLKGRLTPDFDLFYQSRGSNHAFFVPAGISYQREIGQLGHFRSYGGGSANAVLTDLRSDQDGIQSRFRPAYGGSVFAGLQFGTRTQVEVRYYAFTRVRTIDLSGLSIQAGYRF